MPICAFCSRWPARKLGNTWHERLCTTKQQQGKKNALKVARSARCDATLQLALPRAALAHSCACSTPHCAVSRRRQLCVGVDPSAPIGSRRDAAHRLLVSPPPTGAGSSCSVPRIITASGTHAAAGTWRWEGARGGGQGSVRCAADPRIRTRGCATPKTCKHILSAGIVCTALLPPIIFLPVSSSRILIPVALRLQFVPQECARGVPPTRNSVEELALCA